MAIHQGQGGYVQTIYIYAITRTETGDAYIGSTITPKQRWIRHRCHLKLNKHHSPHLQRAWNKYGKDAFTYEVLASRECESHSDRLSFELSWVAKSGHYNVLISSLDESHFTSSPEKRAAHSKSIREKISTDPEYREFLRTRGAAISAYMKSAEGRANMAEHSKRRWKDPKERERLQAGLIRTQQDPEIEKRRSANIAKAHSTPEMKAMHKTNHEKLMQNPEVVAKMLKGSQDYWSNPENREKRAEKMRQYHARRRAEKLANASQT